MGRLNWEKPMPERIDSAIDHKDSKSQPLRNPEEDVCIYCDCIVAPNEGYLETKHGRVVSIHEDCLMERNEEEKRNG